MRTRQHRCALFAVAAISSGFAARSVEAFEVEEEVIHLTWSAPGTCSTREALIDQIATHTSKVRWESAKVEQARAVDVRIVPQADSISVSMVLTNLDRSQSSRNFNVETCLQATRTLALIIALSVDPRANTRGVSTEDRAEPPRDTESPRFVSKQSALLFAPPDSAPTSARTTWTLSAGADAETLRLVSSDPVVALGFHLEVERTDPFSFRVSFRRTLSSQVESPAGPGGRFQWTWIRIDQCPVTFGKRFYVRPCAGLDVGEITAEGTGLPGAIRRGRPWVTAGLFARGGLRVGALRASLDVGVSYMFTQESFTFTPAPFVYDVPAFAPMANVSLGGASSW